MSQSLKILGKSSSINVRKVLWLCHELGLSVEQEQWGSGFQPTQNAEFVALNPNAQVPVLLDGDFVLWESNSICRYLVNRQGNGPLLPAKPKVRAVVEQWMDWQATELNTAWRYAFMALVRQDPAYQDTAAITKSIVAWNRQMTLLDAQLELTGAFVTGSEFTLADIVLGLSANRWQMTPLPHAALPSVQRWYQRLCQREGFRLYGCNGIA